MEYFIKQHGLWAVVQIVAISVCEKLRKVAINVSTRLEQ